MNQMFRDANYFFSFIFGLFDERNCQMARAGFELVLPTYTPGVSVPYHML